MDIIDNASTLEDLHREAALSMHRLNHSAVSATHCVERTIPIPDSRRKAVPGVRLCIDCAELEEIHAKFCRG